MNKTLAFLGALVAVGGASAAAHSAYPTGAAVSRSNLRGATHFAVPGLNAPHVALQAFDFRFTNGDHKIKSIGLMPEKNAVRTAFQDHDGNDNYNLKARFFNSPWPSGRIVRRSNCKKSCEIPIKNYNASGVSHFSLAGFRLTRKSGESNVRQIKLRMSADQSQLQVAFRDNGGFLFDVEVAYVTMPRSSFAKYGTKVIRRTKNEAQLRFSLPTSGRPILQGFDLEFENGDHHLKEFVVEGDNGGFTVRFNDNNYDDPYRGTIDWGVMKP
jgi:hypothetical protein